MAVRMRLFRMGRKKMPCYRIVVVDSKVRRDGRYLEKLGFYNPLTKPETVVIDKEKVIEWLKKGAEPTDTVFNILQKQGIALEWHMMRNNLDDKARSIELQKWEMSRNIKTPTAPVAPVESKPEPKTKPEEAPQPEPVEEEKTEVVEGESEVVTPETPEATEV
ncbi:MAG: 30S ribosomal protein S16 [Candidatus Neomarinimicrobiota bacterium]